MEKECARKCSQQTDEHGKEMKNEQKKKEEEERREKNWRENNNNNNIFRRIVSGSCVPRPTRLAYTISLIPIHSVHIECVRMEMPIYAAKRVPAIHRLCCFRFLTSSTPFHTFDSTEWSLVLFTLSTAIWKHYRTGHKCTHEPYTQTLNSLTIFWQFSEQMYSNCLNSFNKSLHVIYFHFMFSVKW